MFGPAPTWADGTGAVEPRSGGLRHLTLRRRSLRRRSGLQPQVREDPLDHRRFEDGRDDLELPTAVRAVLQVDLEHSLEQPGPADAPRPAVFAGWLSVIVRPVPSLRLGSLPGNI